ncbi:hypothetical protein KAI87_10445 [Myxococcota bacterium]|nr:hypothetical protein [Myxococcota bacterium]
MPHVEQVQRILDEEPDRVNAFVDLLYVLVNDRLSLASDNRADDSAYVELAASKVLAELLSDEASVVATLELMVRAEASIIAAKKGDTNLSYEESITVVIMTEALASEFISEAIGLEDPVPNSSPDLLLN